MKKMAYLGPEYTFSDVCFKMYYGASYKPLHVKTIEAAFEALNDDTDILVPIENSTDGFVQKTLDELIDKKYYIVSTMSIPVQFGCIGHPEKAHKIYVQFKSLGQCQTFMKKYPHLDVILTASNQASFDSKKHDDEAAIVPLHMIHDMFHIPHVEDYQNNQTRFIHVSKNPSKAYTFAAMVITPKIDRPGLLKDILSIFETNDINLIAIMSRPTKVVSGTYHFYIETALSKTKADALENVLDMMRKTFDVTFLGTYKKK